jgi:hypothetical protein
MMVADAPSETSYNLNVLKTINNIKRNFVMIRTISGGGKL